MLAPTPENFRAEMARHYLNRAAICQHNGMNPNELSMYINGIRPLTSVAAHNIGYAINRAAEVMIFDVDMDKGPVRPKMGRPPKPATTTSIKLPTKKRKKKRYLRKAGLGTHPSGL